MKHLVIALTIISLLGMGMVYAEESEGAKKDPVAEKQSLAKAVKVSMADALAIASKKSSGTVMGMELENEGGKLIYSFEFLPTMDSKSIKEVNVNAVTGEVVSVGNEDIVAEAAESAAPAQEKKEEGKWDAMKIKVDVSKLPAAVKSTVKKEAAGSKIKSASTMPKIYSVTVQKGEETSSLLITSSGKLIEKELKKEGSEEKDEKKEAPEKGEKDEKD